MTSSWRPRRPQASRPSPASDAGSSDDSTLDGDAQWYSRAELGLLVVELCGPDTNLTIEAPPLMTMKEIAETWQREKRVKYDLCISTPYTVVDLARTLSDIVMARRVDFEPWDASTDIVLYVAPVNHTAQTVHHTDTSDGKVTIVIRGVDRSTVKSTATSRVRLSLIAQDYAQVMSNGGRHKAYRFVYAGRLLDPRSEVGDIAPIGMSQFEILAVVDETACLPGTASL